MSKGNHERENETDTRRSRDRNKESTPVVVGAVAQVGCGSEPYARLARGH